MRAKNLQSHSLALALGLFLALAQVAAAATCVFRWEPVKSMSDGTKVDILGYKLYSAVTPGGFGSVTVTIPLVTLPDKNSPSYTTECTQGYSWVVTAFTATTEGLQSQTVLVPSVLEAAKPFRLQRMVTP
jgi:hypothetical protein